MEKASSLLNQVYVGIGWDWRHCNYKMVNLKLAHFT